MADDAGGGRGDIDASNWTALLARKATPQPILDKLDAEVVKILNMPDVRNASPAAAWRPFRRAQPRSTPHEREAAVYRVIIEKADVHVD